MEKCALKKPSRKNRKSRRATLKRWLYSAAPIIVTKVIVEAIAQLAQVIPWA